MAETIGMLCDKLTIVKLKQYHTEDEEKLKSLSIQSKQLQEEIDEYISDSIAGKIAVEKMTFQANKVFKKEGNDIKSFDGSFGEVFYQLANVNCLLWHEQEKVYNFEDVPVEEKNHVVKKLAHLNLERNQCIDLLNKQFSEFIKQSK